MKIDILALRNELLCRCYCDTLNVGYEPTMRIPTETEIREMFLDFEDYEVYIDLIVDGKIDRLELDIAELGDVCVIPHLINGKEVSDIHIAKDRVIEWDMSKGSELGVDDVSKTGKDNRYDEER